MLNIFFIVMLSVVVSGCQPARERDEVKRPSILIEPGYLSLTNFLQSLSITVVFSNSTDSLVVLAKDDIDLFENMAIVSRKKLLNAKSKFELANTFLFNPAGNSKEIEIVRLKPNETFKLGLDLMNLASCGVCPESYTDDIYVVFFGWPNEHGIGYKIDDFPKKLRPFVWRDAVTSTPVRVDFAESGDDCQIRGGIRGGIGS